jgi:dihydropyrimidinase
MGQAVSDPFTEVIDATGCFVLPGGVDPHVHMHLPTSAGYSSDDFISGSRAAIFGGTTTLIDFVTPQRTQPLIEALSLRQDEAKACMTDFSLHVSPVAWRNSLPAEIKACVEQGITSFKLYMAYKDTIGLGHDALERVMQAIGEAGGMAIIHCELGDEIEVLRSSLFAAGKTTPSSHPLSRPPETESRAVKMAIAMAEKARCPLYIVHVSAAASLAHIREAREKGQAVFAEVCPHHLLLDEASYEKPFEQSAPFVMSPPLRKKSDRDALWQALSDGTIQVVGTDHCPFMMEQKLRGRHDFRMIANGAGGVEHRLELLYTYGVLAGRISMERFVDVVSTNPACIFGLYPNKGTIEPGADADLVVWNPGTSKIITAANHHQHCDHNIYEGMAVQGRAEFVVKNGVTVIKEGALVSESPGRFLPRNILTS